MANKSIFLTLHRHATSDQMSLRSAKTSHYICPLIHYLWITGQDHV